MSMNPNTTYKTVESHTLPILDLLPVTGQAYSGRY